MAAHITVRKLPKQAPLFSFFVVVPEEPDLQPEELQGEEPLPMEVPFGATFADLTAHIFDYLFDEDDETQKKPVEIFFTLDRAAQKAITAKPDDLLTGKIAEGATVYASYFRNRFGLWFLRAPFRYGYQASEATQKQPLRTDHCDRCNVKLGTESIKIRSCFERALWCPDCLKRSLETKDNGPNFTACVSCSAPGAKLIKLENSDHYHPSCDPPCDVPIKQHRCAVCQLPLIKVLCCSRCRKSTYCSANCQTKDWPSHKLACNVPAS